MNAGMPVNLCKRITKQKDRRVPLHPVSQNPLYPTLTLYDLKDSTWSMFHAVSRLHALKVTRDVNGSVYLDCTYDGNGG